MSHRDFHPSDVEGCFGCKVAGLGYDGRHFTRTQTDENRALITEHRDGRQDVTIRPRTVRLVTKVEET